MSRRNQSKPVSKPVREAPKPKPVISDSTFDPIGEIHRAYEFFDQNDNKRIDPYELKIAMQALGYDAKNPGLYSLVADLDTVESEKAGGVTMEDCEKAIAAKLGEQNSKDNLRKVFDLLVGDENSDTITIDSLKAISKEVGQGLTDDEVTNCLKQAVRGRDCITFDEFYDIMTKKA